MRLKLASSFFFPLYCLDLFLSKNYINFTKKAGPFSPFFHLHMQTYTEYWILCASIEAQGQFYFVYTSILIPFHIILKQSSDFFIMTTTNAPVFFSVYP